MHLLRGTLAFAVWIAMGCASARNTGDTGGVATARIRDASGKELGTLRLEGVPGGVRLMGQLTGLPPGRHTLKAWVDSKTTHAQVVELADGAVLSVAFP